MSRSDVTSASVALRARGAYGSAQGRLHPDDTPADRVRDEWGPLGRTELDAFAMHEALCESLPIGTPERARTIERLGYEDEAHFERVRRTFLKYYGIGEPDAPISTYVWGDRASEAIALARRALEASARSATSSDGTGPAGPAGRRDDQDSRSR
ncbi:MAG: hypothetical protein NZ898_03325 [Myxococcota bacterium]|nr:hypothetical protein [Myxococcota bacterium]MDW8361743.1 hypothetical protein [Myxococcales bacterium]